MPTPGELRPEDLLAAIDAALLQNIALRAMVARYLAEPEYSDGECKHLSQTDMMGGAVYCDECGTLLHDPASGDGVSATATPTG